MSAPAGPSGRDRETSRSRPTGDRLVALVVIAVAAVLYGVSLTIEDAPSSLARGMQPATFPQLVLYVAAGLGVFLFAKPGPPPLGTHIGWLTGATALACIGGVYAFKEIGAFLTMALFAGGLAFLWGERRVWVLVPYTLLVPLAVWLLFAKVLDVYFPSRLLEILSGG